MYANVDYTVLTRGYVVCCCINVIVGYVALQHNIITTMTTHNGDITSNTLFIRVV